MNKKILNNNKPNIKESSNDNMNTIKNLQYKIDKNIININVFDTIIPYSNNKFYVQDLIEIKGRILHNKEESIKKQLKYNRLSMSFQ